MIFDLKISLTAILAMLFLSAPAFAGWDPNAEQKALDTVAAFKKNDSGMEVYFSKARGYVVYPSVGKAGFVIGGAHGKGIVFEAGKAIGTSSLTQASIGFQLGGQAFSEIMFFKDKRAYDEFTSGSFEFDAAASAVAITAGVQAKAGTEGASAGASAGPATGVQANTSYRKGMAVFVHTKGGLMYEAAIGGQKFNFKPKE